VCELVPSGTIPVIVAPEPPAIFATMLVIGATVVAMLTGPSMMVVEVQLTGETSDSIASLDVFEQPAVTTKAAEIKRTMRDFMPRD
jgi:hypothetical protein